MHNGKSSRLRQRVAWSVVGLAAAAMLALVTFDAVTLPGCTSCHLEDAFRTATASSAHTGVDCRSCHVPAGAIGRLGFALRQPLHMYVPLTPGAVRDAAAVPDSRCLACHADIGDKVTEADGLRIAHKSCAAGSSCSACHSTTAHGKATAWPRVYEMDDCLGCHANDSNARCDLCHEGRDRASAIDSPTFRVTHGPEWRSTHGMGDGSTCVVCHGKDDCIQCHGPGVPHDPDFVRLHPKSARDEAAKCDGCHEDSFCDACHGTPMPHTRTFTKGHAKTAKAERALCERCHAAEDCTVCHDKHVHPGGAVGGTVNTMGGGD